MAIFKTRIRVESWDLLDFFFDLVLLQFIILFKVTVLVSAINLSILQVFYKCFTSNSWCFSDC